MPSDRLAASPDVDIVSERRVWSGRFQLDVVGFRHRRFDGSFSGERTWELFRRGRAAALIPYDPWSDQVVLIEQFRLPAYAAGVDPVMVELPAGLCDDGEDPAETARREAAEEMGVAVDHCRRVGDFVLTPGGSDELCTLFVGRVRAPSATQGGLIGTGGLASEHEDIRARLWSADDAIDQAVAGRFPNAVTTLGLLWLAAARDRLRTEWALA